MAFLKESAKMPTRKLLACFQTNRTLDFDLNLIAFFSFLWRGQHHRVFSSPNLFSCVEERKKEQRTSPDKLRMEKVPVSEFGWISHIQLA